MIAYLVSIVHFGPVFLLYFSNFGPIFCFCFGPAFFFYRSVFTLFCSRGGSLYCNWSSFCTCSGCSNFRGDIVAVLIKFVCSVFGCCFWMLLFSRRDIIAVLVQFLLLFRSRFDDCCSFCAHIYPDRLLE